MGAAGATAREGSPEPLGATVTADGVNFAVWSSAATAIEVCLFDDTGQVETARHTLPGRTGPVFHGLIPGVAAGARYGLRAHGPFDPAQGHRFDPDKLLLDPYALELDRPFAFDAVLLAEPRGVDSAPAMPKAVARAAGAFPGPPGPPPAIPWGETVIYEASVRGFTRLNPDIPADLRGTFAAFGRPAAIAHLLSLGVTTLELMPAAAWIDEGHLGPLGLTNAWGYNPVALMAPDPRLAPGGWAEVRAAVDALAAAGIETLVDIVLNHSGEGDAHGPTVSLRGLDNAAYYRLQPDDPAAYVNDAGTGSILALDRSPGLRLAMDSLRAWRRLGGVHGFRFDLATVMGRRPVGFDPAAPLLAAIDQDPDLRGLKLIAEPWDCGPGGYQIGRFPPVWGEWNDRYRDTVRGFWRGDPVSRGELARRLAGSEDLFAGRRPSRSLNYVVAHDGFTLADLVAYQRKSNLANGEDNRDGTDDNRSWNHGVEGPTTDPAIVAARLADQRALLATLLLSRGTPMLPMGAECGRTQGGNNNAYAQDNAVGWLDWTMADGGLIDFTRRLLALRRRHPALRADRFLTGRPTPTAAWPDVEWRTASGRPLRYAEWDDVRGETLVMALSEPGDGGPDRVVLALHRGPSPTEIVLPDPRDGFVWRLEVDSAGPARALVVQAPTVPMTGRSVALLVETPAPARRPGGVSAEALARLAAAAGVAPDWRAADGGAHVVPADTLQALLAGMGLDARATGAARESLRRFAEDQDRRPLPFALTGRGGESPTVTLAETTAPPRTWLVLEDESGRLQRLRAAAGHGVEMTIRARDGAETRGLALRLPPLSPGRYRMWREDHPDQDCRLTVAPPACHAPAVLQDGRRLWGLSAQIYSLARSGDQGIGDFTTLGDLAGATADRGGAVLGVNPFHMLFPADRERASPYYPSDRRFLDPIYLDLDKVAHAPAGGGEPASPAAIDHPAVWTAKFLRLEASFAAGRCDPDFAAFVAAGGERLRRFATFEAIAETRPGVGWRRWPEGLRGPDTADVQAFATAHADRVDFHRYLQWLCDRQLAGAAWRGSGLSLGICRDLALGAAPDGAELWAEGDLVAPGVSIGAPPDPFGPQGQVWGLPPFDPHRLRANGYRDQAELFAVNMRHAGALRIDHVMGMARQFWIPDGATALDGAYVDYPFGDLLNVLALESQRAACLIIGEDLGTVPDGFREMLTRAGVLSYRVLPFERAGRGFKAPADYPREAWACVSTHDLPPLAGWWDGVDIDERESLGLITRATAQAARTDRADDKAALDDALIAEALIDDPAPPDGPLPADIAAALHAYVASSPAMLAVAQAEDLAGERAAVNLPGTDRERPNWRRRLARPVESLFDGPLAEGIVKAMRRGREP